jgi:maltooligosyltrehalose trehalohydrolase
MTTGAVPPSKPHGKPATRKPGLGATYLGGLKTAFKLWAPRADRVELEIVEPEARRIAMEPGGRGYFDAVVDGVGSGTLYRYRLDGREPRPDPASRWQPRGVHGPSAVIDRDFAWSDHDWDGLRLPDLVLYEVHVGTFTSEGTFEAIVPRLDDLVDLGVTAIELMPIAEFPGVRNWGYDGAYPYAVHHAYSGPDGLRRLVDASHARGLGVVLDVVYNHLGPEGNYLAEYGPYFTDRYRTPWGDALNFDGAGSDQVRRYFIENAVMWVRDYHIDGLRLDAAHAILDLSARPFLEELGHAVHAEGDRLGRRVLVIPESDNNDPRLIQTTGQGGLGLDAVWCDDFHHALHAVMTGETQGYYQDFGDLECLEWAFTDGFVYAGQYSKYRARRHGHSSRALPAERFVVCLQNHDQVGNRAKSDRISSLVDFESLKLGAAAYLLSPFIPLLFMGEEYGETRAFPYFVDHSDPGLVESVREGRQAEFAAFDWEVEIPDPSSEETFASARPSWDWSDERNGKLRAWYKELLRLRREVPALSRRSKELLDAETMDDERVIVVHRWADGLEGPHHGGEVSEILLLLHFGDTRAEPRIRLPAGSWKVVLDSAARAWGGPGSILPEAVESEEGATAVHLTARSAVLLERAG